MPVGAAGVPCWDTLDGRHSLVRGGTYATIASTTDGRADCAYLAANLNLCGDDVEEETLFRPGEPGPGEPGSGEAGSGDVRQTFRALDVCCACGGGTSTAPPPPPAAPPSPPPSPGPADEPFDLLGLPWCLPMRCSVSAYALIGGVLLALTLLLLIWVRYRRWSHPYPHPYP